MATADEHGKDIHTDEPERRANNFTLGMRILAAVLGIVSLVYLAFEIPMNLKLVVIVLAALFWVLFEISVRRHISVLDRAWKVLQKRKEAPRLDDRKAQAPSVRWGLGGLLLLFLIGWGYGKAMEPPPIPETIYYMVVLDASDAMKEPFDMYPSKWIAVREAFQGFYERSNPDSNYGLALIGGQNPQERSRDPCSLPTVPLIPVVSENGKALPHKKLTLPKLQEQVEGQQPQGGGSMSRAFFLAKNQLEALESLPLEASKVIVLIANASDTCEGKIDWETLAGEIELVNKIAVRKELILLDVEATQETTAFAEKMNALNDPNMIVQVVQTYNELVMSISFVVERDEAAEAALETAATAMAQSENGPAFQPFVGGGEPATPVIIPSQPPMPRRVIVAASATSTATLTPTFTSTATITPTFTSTFTSTPTFTNTPTLTSSPTTPAPTIILVPTAVRPTREHKRDKPERCGAVCVDGTISSSTGSGTCSYHDGVKKWLYPPNCP